MESYQSNSGDDAAHDRIRDQRPHPCGPHILSTLRLALVELNAAGGAPRPGIAPSPGITPRSRRVMALLREVVSTGCPVRLESLSRALAGTAEPREVRQAALRLHEMGLVTLTPDRDGAGLWVAQDAAGGAE